MVGKWEAEKVVAGVEFLERGRTDHGFSETRNQLINTKDRRKNNSSSSVTGFFRLKFTDAISILLR